MKEETIHKILRDVCAADTLLTEVSVRGDDVYRIVKTRALLKRAHVMLTGGEEAKRDAADTAE